MPAITCPKCGIKHVRPALKPNQVFRCTCGAQLRVPGPSRTRPGARPGVTDAESTPLGLSDQAAFDRAFSKVAVERGFATEKQIRESLETQKRMAQIGVRKSLDLVMVDKGLITLYQSRRLSMLVKEGGRVTEIGGFQITGKLGKGGMGTVYRARQISLDREVALKILPRQLADDKSYIERFLREARSAARLNHPNIVQAIDAGEDRGFYYFAMELVDGQSLKAIINRVGHLDVVQSCRITMDIARALHYAWQEQQMIHRDVKPDNILINRHGLAKLADLGLAKSRRTDSGLTVSGLVIGTPHYISPEQVEGTRELDPRSDIYSLGCTLFHMLTGRVPFQAENPAGVFVKHVTAPPPDPREVLPELPERLALAVNKCLQKDREQRFQSMRDLANELESFLAECPAPQQPAGQDILPLRAQDVSMQPTILLQSQQGAASQAGDIAEGRTHSDSVPPPLPDELPDLREALHIDGHGDESAFKRIPPTPSQVAERRRRATGRMVLFGLAVAALTLVVVLAAWSLLAPARATYERQGPPMGRPADRPPAGGAEPVKTQTTEKPTPLPAPVPSAEGTPAPLPGPDLPSVLDEDADVVGLGQLPPLRQAVAGVLGGRVTCFGDGSLEVIYDFTTSRQYQDFGLAAESVAAVGGLPVAAGSRSVLSGVAGGKPSAEPVFWSPVRPLRLTLRVINADAPFRVELRSSPTERLSLLVDRTRMAVELSYRDQTGRVSKSKELSYAETREMVVRVLADGNGRFWLAVNAGLVAIEGALPAPLSLSVAGEGEAGNGPANCLITSLSVRGTPDDAWAERMAALEGSRAPKAERKARVVVRRDGSGDTASIVEALARVQPRGVVELGDTGPYRIEKPVEVEFEVTIQAPENVTALVELPGTLDQGLRFKDGVTLRNLFVRMAGREKAGNPSVGLVLDGARNCVLKNCVFLSGPNSAPVLLTGRASHVGVSDCLFVGWPLDKARAYALGLITEGWSGSALSVQHCTFWGLAQHAAVVTHFNPAQPAPVELTDSIIGSDDDVVFGPVGRWERNCYTPGSAAARRLLAAEGAAVREGRGNFVAWPGLASPYNFEFSLEANSPCLAVPQRDRPVGVAWPQARWGLTRQVAAVVGLHRGGATGGPLPVAEEINLLAADRRAEWTALSGKLVTTINGVEFGPDPRGFWLRFVPDWELRLEWSATAAGRVSLCVPGGEDEHAPSVRIAADGKVTVFQGQTAAPVDVVCDLQRTQALEAVVRGTRLAWSLNGVKLPDLDLQRSAAEIPFSLEFQGTLLIKKAALTLRLPPQPVPIGETAGAAETATATPPGQVDTKPNGTAIFDGASLDGWKAFGGSWTVDKGAIVGRGEKEAGGQYFLLYGKPLPSRSRVRLWYEFRYDEGNSGDLYFRGLVVSFVRLAEGKVLVMPASRFAYMSPEIAAKNVEKQETLDVVRRVRKGRWVSIMVLADDSEMALYADGQPLLRYPLKQSSDTGVGFFYSPYCGAEIRNVQLTVERSLTSIPAPAEAPPGKTTAPPVP